MDPSYEANPMNFKIKLTQEFDELKNTLLLLYLLPIYQNFCQLLLNILPLLMQVFTPDILVNTKSFIFIKLTKIGVLYVIFQYEVSIPESQVEGVELWWPGNASFHYKPVLYAGTKLLIRGFWWSHLHGVQIWKIGSRKGKRKKTK